ncbi:MAG TPA: ankyrin repeat domain-containing protein, partial [Bryobacteraceae bacterium]|nr:ankyrin repeat domain-containing protein [Bryobacteraceae bacterium]
MLSGLLAGTVLSMLGSGLGFAAVSSDLADAVMNRSTERVLALLSQKADVNAPQADGTTALLWAVRHDDLATIDQLIGAGADVKARNR